MGPEQKHTRHPYVGDVTTNVLKLNPFPQNHTNKICLESIRSFPYSSYFSSCYEDQETVRMFPYFSYPPSHRSRKYSNAVVEVTKRQHFRLHFPSNARALVASYERPITINHRQSHKSPNSHARHTLTLLRKKEESRILRNN